LESSSSFLPSVGVDPCDELIQLSPSSCDGGFLVIGVDGMIGSMWRWMEAEAINRRTPRAKGVPNRAQSGLGQSSQADRPRPVSSKFGLGFSPVASRVIPYMCPLACGPLTSFPSRLRFGFLLSKLRCFLVESLKTCTLMHRSSGHLESCSSRVLTLVGLHDLLPKCLVNLSRKSPLYRRFTA
jgi:hypothetical protein